MTPPTQIESQQPISRALLRIEGIVRLGARVVLGVVIIVVGHVLGKMLRSVIQTRNFSLRSVSAQSNGPSAPPPSSRVALIDDTSPVKRLDSTAVLLGSIAYWTVQAATIGIILMVLGLQVGGILATLASVGIIVGVAVQGILNDAVAGIVISTNNVFQIGEMIEVRDVVGIVTDFNIIQTVLMDTSSRVRTIVPNRILQDSVLKNHSRHPVRAYTIEVRVAISSARDIDVASAAMERGVRVAIERNIIRGVPDAARPAAGAANVSDGTVMRIIVPILAEDFAPRRMTELVTQVRKELLAAGINLSDRDK